MGQPSSVGWVVLLRGAIPPTPAQDQPLLPQQLHSLCLLKHSAITGHTLSSSLSPVNQPTSKARWTPTHSSSCSLCFLSQPKPGKGSPHLLSMPPYHPHS